MALPGMTALGCRSSASFGIHSERRNNQHMKKIQSKKKRFSILVVLGVITFTVVLMCLFIYDSSRIISSSKSKRIVELAETEKLENIPQLKQIARNESKQDIMLVPETGEDSVDRRSDEHPNHRYESSGNTEEFVERVMKNIYTNQNWSPQPFKIAPEMRGKPSTLNNIQDIIKNVEMNENHIRKTKDPNFRPYKDLSKPIRFKGVYVRPKEEKEVTEQKKIEKENQDYLQEINQLLYSAINQPENNQQFPAAAGFKPEPGLRDFHKGSESHVYPQVVPRPFPFNPRDLKTSWTNQNQEVIQKPKKKPITVMLDIYPMTKLDETEEVVRKPKKEMIYIPIRPGEEFFEPFPSPSKTIPLNLVPPNQRKVFHPKKNRMIMKLNLYPKNKEWRREQNEIYNTRTDSRIGEVIYPKRAAERRTFGLFHHLKKKFHHDDCDILGHNPYGKPITAKWKDKNGDWVHAKLVALKQWDDWHDWHHWKGWKGWKDWKDWKRRDKEVT